MSTISYPWIIKLTKKILLSNNNQFDISMTISSFAKKDQFHFDMTTEGNPIKTFCLIKIRIDGAIPQSVL